MSAPRPRPAPNLGPGRSPGSLGRPGARGVGARGPVPASPDAVDALIDWARSAKMARLLIEPKAPAAFSDALAEPRFPSPTPTQSQHTRIVQLRPPDDLPKGFRHGRRYNIRTGLRRGVVVKEGKDAAELARQSAAVERRESIYLPGRR